ncbi:MAG: TRIC cation channel family protein [Caldilineaceae bacterium]|nr:TRIC cation channel family protein [Caldilineaceae bacterium]
MSQPEFQVPMVFDYFATFLWALSGSIVGMHKRYDLAGVLVIAVLASTGGSLIRDGIFLNRRPPVVGDGWYIPLILAAVAVVGLFRQRISRMPFVDRLISVIDALGVPAFAVVGMQLSLRAGIPYPGVVLIGVINGFGGGLLRDVVVDDTPTVLKPGQFALSALLFACVVFLLLARGFGLTNNLAAWSMIGLYFAIRMLSIRFNWRTQPVLPHPPA